MPKISMERQNNQYKEKAEVGTNYETWTLTTELQQRI